MAAIKFFIIINGSICEQHADNNCVFFGCDLKVLAFERMTVYLCGCENFRFRNFEIFSPNFLFRVSRNFPRISRNYAKHEIKICATFRNFAKTKSQFGQHFSNVKKLIIF